MNLSDNKHVIVVLGMHRSGTSSITRSLKVLGVELGSRLMPPAENENKKGFWEDLDIYEINVTLMTALGHDWHTLSPVLTQEFVNPALQSLKLQAIELLRKKLAPVEVLGLKDPRFSRLLPFWMEVFKHLGVRVSYVIACRNPLSVYRSLSRRNGFDQEKVYYLWQEHILSSITHSSGENRIIVDYDRLLDDTSNQLERIAACIGLPFDAESNEFHEFKKEFLEDELRHARFLPEDLAIDKSIPVSVVELYRILCEIAADRNSFDNPDVVTLLSSLNLKMAEIGPALAYMRICEDRATREHELVGKRDGEINTLTQDLIEREGTIRTLESSIETQRLQLQAEWGQRVVDLEHLVAEERIAHHHQLALVQEARNVLAQEATAQALEAVRLQVTSAHGHAERHQTLQERLLTREQEMVSKRDGEITTLSQDLAERDRAIRTLESSIETQRLQLQAEWGQRVIDLEHLVAEERTAHQHQLALVQEAMAQALEQEQLLTREQEMVSKRDGEITTLSQDLAERDRAIRTLESSIESQRLQLQAEWGQRVIDLEHLVAEERTAHQHQLALVQEARNVLAQEATAHALETVRLQVTSAQGHAERERILQQRLLDAVAEMRLVERTSEDKVAELRRRAALNDATVREQFQARMDTLQQTVQAQIAASNEALLREERVLRTEQHAELVSRLDALQRSSQSTEKQLRAELHQHQALSAHLQQILHSIHISWYWRWTTFLRWLSPIPGIKQPFANSTFSSSPAPDKFREPPSTMFIPQDHDEVGVKVETVDDLLQLHDAAFVRQAYLSVLLREPDPQGMAYYLGRLRQGIGKLHILGQLRRSKEGRLQQHELAGLDAAIRKSRRSQLPLLGGLMDYLSGHSKQAVLAKQLNVVVNQTYISGRQNMQRLEQLHHAVQDIGVQINQQSEAMMANLAFGTAIASPDIDSWLSFESLMQANSADFLNRAFRLTLGRAPEAHESDHYLHLLEKGCSKHYLLTILFESQEFKNRRLLTSTARAESREAGAALPSPKPQMDLIELKTQSEPIVSVIIPVYGKVEYTLMCLESIARHPPEVPFEVIVVDDCSPDETFARISSIKGVRLHRNDSNLGFIRSCNAGARLAHGKYLHFLNNDTEVTAGWLDELVRTFHEFPGTGFVGSKLVYPDGTLQEAGGILWQDGSAWNFGRNQDPALPVFNYAREVDYCSGASIMVPSTLFSELGGFDEHYLPAYCEDSDLALKVRDRGYRVIYQPLSVVVHYEGITSGTDTNQGAKAYQIENSKKLFLRWKDRLQQHQLNGMDVDSAKDRVAKRRVLVLDHCTPTPNQDAGSVTVFNLLLLLREADFQVTFIAEDNFLYMPEYTTALQRAGVEVLYAPYVTTVEQHLKECGDRYDLAFLFRPVVVERNIKAIRKHCSRAKVLYHTVDLHFLRMQREAELQSDKAKMKQAAEMKQRELAAMRSADASIVHSTVELELLRKELFNKKIYVFPLIMGVRGTNKGFSDRRDIVFVGGYQHTPNVDAVQFFISEVMPLLRKKLHGVRFYAVGSKPPAEIQKLVSEDVIITGFVEDLDPLLDKMRVSVAPLRYGAGIKGKIGSAMAVGLPVVATSLAVEGMSLIDGENILVADEAEAFASTVAKLYENEYLWKNISHAGLACSEKLWGSEAAWSILNIILNDIGMSVIRGRHPLKLFSSSDDGFGVKQQTNDFQAQHGELHPISIVRDREEFQRALSLDIFTNIRSIETSLVQTAINEHFIVNGKCVPCDRSVSFTVDMLSGGQRRGEDWIPNWRERVECPFCHMNNRQRLIATLVKQRLNIHHKNRARVYFMEQVTPIIQWTTKMFSNHCIFGSEYLGHEYTSGEVINGIRHEDVMNLSFESNSLDLIVSNDVFEHVPNPAQAFRECARVLRHGGVMLATIPFHAENDESIVRANLSPEGVTHILAPMYHGNPVSSEGSLVFTDFGWDMLTTVRESGFSDIQVSIFASEELAHFGSGQIVFEATR